MEKDQIVKLLMDSIRELFITDCLLMNKDYDINERAVVQKLATYIGKRVSDYHVDVEYNRMRDYYGPEQIGNITPKKIAFMNTDHKTIIKNVNPDIIVHKRDQEENLIAIEIKLAWKNEKKEYDFSKINGYMEQLRYQFGVYIELAEKEEDCKIEFGPFL